MMQFVVERWQQWKHWRAQKLNENAATDILAAFLNKSAKSRKVLTNMLKTGGFNMPLIDRVKTQVILKDLSRPDMVGYDKTNAMPLLVESKFQAALGKRQASRYIEQKTTALLFIVPGARVEKLWSKIVQQIGEDSPGTKLGPTTSANGWRSTMATGVPRLRAWWTLNISIPAWWEKPAPKRLALVSWDRLLGKMTDPDIAKDVKKLRNIVKKQEC